MQDEAVQYLRTYKGNDNFLIAMQGLLFQGRELSSKQAATTLTIRDKKLRAKR